MVCPPLWWCYVQWACSAPCFGSQLSEVQLVFSLFVSCPQFVSTVYTLSCLYSHVVSLYCVAQGDVCPGASMWQRIPGSKSQPVSKGGHWVWGMRESDH